MRTHKLIKTYPGSPPLNSIFKESDKHPNLLVSEDGMSHLVKYYITNHPEFWEEIKEVTKGSSTISISNNFQKYIPKKPLFTTHDKVDIFEGDFCWAGYTYERSLSDYVYGEWSGNGLNMIYFAKKENLITHLNSLNSEIIESEPKSNHKIVSFGPNPRTGGVYTYNKYTDKYHSDISLIQISYKNCLQYPIRSVINTEKNLFKIRDSVNRLNTKSNTKFNIIYFDAVKKEKIVYAYIKKQKKRSKLIKVNIDNLEHFVE